MKRKRENTTGIPDCELDAIARALLTAIQRIFEDEKTKVEFQEWKANRRKHRLESQSQDEKKENL